MQLSVTELPFNSFIGIEAADGAGQLLRLPTGGQYLNHLGTVHASALLALAEASSGEFLLRGLAHWRGWHWWCGDWSRSFANQPMGR